MSGAAVRSAAASSYRAAPLRGTQSFVGVMSAVWKRPSLAGLELLWRWGIGVPTLALCAWEALRISHVVTVNTAALEAMTVFKPVDAAGTIATTLRGLAPAALPVLAWLVPLLLLARTIAAGIGRAAVQRRLNTQLSPRASVLFILSALRAIALLAAVAAWILVVRWANGFTITGPAAHAQEPNLVLFCAIAIFATLGLFLLWAGSIWMLDAAFLMEGVRRAGLADSLRSAVHLGRTRGKLVEINLVMGIVKVALLVLALVFSACPLPFQSVESTEFLVSWSVGVAVLYFVASDYFHVVRAAAYLALYRAGEQKGSR